MTYISNKDFMLEVAKGRVSNHYAVNKFGRNTDVDTVVNEDVWENGGTWVAPTTARTHDIVSTSTDDASAGVGARTIQVYGLTAWDASEVSETITLNGTTNVATTNSYVIIHRMKVLTKGATNVNVGTITATAQTDATVTAQINASQGQTQMAIYGIPSTQSFYLTNYYASAIKDATALSIDINLFVNPEPDTELTNFLTKHTSGAATEGTSYTQKDFKPYYKISGPAIIKIQVGTSVNDTDVSAGFDGILIDNV